MVCSRKIVNGHMQVGQFEGIVQHCLATPGVHVIDLPINYAVSAQLQVCALPQCLLQWKEGTSGVFPMTFWTAPLIGTGQQVAGQEQGRQSVQRPYAGLGGDMEPLDPCAHPWPLRGLAPVRRCRR